MAVKTINLSLGRIGEIGGVTGSVTTPAMFTVYDGDQIKFVVGSFKYRGPGLTGKKLWCSVAQHTIPWDDLWWNSSATLTLPSTATDVTVTVPDILVTVTHLLSSMVLECYVKIATDMSQITPDALLFGIDNQINYINTGATHEFSNLNVTYSKV